MKALYIILLWITPIFSSAFSNQQMHKLVIELTNKQSLNTEDIQTTDNLKKRKQNIIKEINYSVKIGGSIKNCDLIKVDSGVINNLTYNMFEYRVSHINCNYKYTITTLKLNSRWKLDDIKITKSNILINNKKLFEQKLENLNSNDNKLLRYLVCHLNKNFKHLVDIYNKYSELLPQSNFKIEQLSETSDITEYILKYSNKNFFLRLNYYKLGEELLLEKFTISNLYNPSFEVYYGMDSITKKLYRKNKLNISYGSHPKIKNILNEYISLISSGSFNNSYTKLINDETKNLTLHYKKILNIKSDKYIIIDNGYFISPIEVEYLYGYITFYILANYRNDNELIKSISYSHLEKYNNVNYDSTQIISDLKICAEICSKSLPIINRDSLKFNILNLKKEIKNPFINQLEISNTLKKIYKFVNLDGHFNFSCALSLSGNVVIPIKKTKIFNNKMYNATNDTIGFGNEIISINGLKIDKLLKENNKNSLSNGHLKYTFLFKYGIFPQNKIIIKNKKSSCLDTLLLNSTSINPLQRKVIDSTHTSKLGDKTMLFKIPNFDNYLYIKNFFNNIDKNVSNLIIDLRNNPGGNVENVNLLYSHIAKGKFPSCIEITRYKQNLVYKNLITSFNRRIIYDKKIIENSIKEFEKNSTMNDNYVTVNKNLDSVPNKNAFTKNVYLLINNKSNSAANFFIKLFKFKKRGIIIGDKKNTKKQFCGGLIVNYELPYTKTDINCPLYKINIDHRITDYINNKSISDHPISDSLRLEYFLQGKDAELEEALKLIRETKL
jgi:hypothetical protein